MRPTARLIRTALLSLSLGVVAWTCAAGGAAGATKLYDGVSDTDSVVATPLATSPADGAALAYPANAVRLAWQPVAGAAAYAVQVARQPTSGSCSSATTFLTDGILLSGTTTDTTWIPAMVDKASGSDIWLGGFCWRVRTTGTGSSAGAWSTPRGFTRTWSSAPSTLRFYNDTDGPIPRTSTDPDFASGDATTRNAGYVAWSPVAGAATYDLEVATSRSFSKGATILTQHGIRASRSVIPHLSDDTYYWRVRANSSSGVAGTWSSDDNSFTVEWDDDAWTATANLYPLDSATTSEVRVGWTPVAGAAYYEYQLGTNPGCFWDPSSPESAPDAYGDWVNEPSKYDTSPTPGLLYTSDPQPTQCRLSALESTTLNNFVTLSDAFDASVFANIGKPCKDEDGLVLCEPAYLPDSVPDDYGTDYHGSDELTMATDGRYGDAYSIYWRVRPVYKLKTDSLTGTKVASEITSYGSWSRFTDAGANRQSRFNLDTSTRVNASTATRCSGPCLVHVGSALTATDVVGVTASSTMQVPVLTWSPYAGAGGYLIQVARDPNFNNPVVTHYEPGIKSIGYGFQQSWAPTYGLEDNSEGTGYWWRVTPCTSTRKTDLSLTNCAPLYSPGSGGKPTSAGPNDDAMAQTFTKRTEVITKVSPNFTGDNPLISWTTAANVNAGASAWAHGVDGAEYYEFQLSKDPNLASPITLKTTSPRLVPFEPSSGETHAELASGRWYYHVRPIDKDGIEGSWSDISSFDKAGSIPTGTRDDSGGVGSTVSWNSVEGADSYTVEYNGVTFTTAQTSAFIPSTATGAVAWRVRSNISNVEGRFSDLRVVNITSAPKLRYGLSAPAVAAGSTTTVEGQLLLAGAASNGKTVQLQRKTTNCNVGGAYRQVAAGVTGKNTSQGMVKFKAKVALSSCYRLAYAGSSAVVYSAPFAIGARPVLKAKVNRRTVRNGVAFCTTVSSKTALTGRTQVQYKVGKKWVVARNSTIRSKKAFRQCAAIAASGTYPLRLAVLGLHHPTQGYATYADTYLSLGKVRVNNVFKKL